MKEWLQDHKKSVIGGVVGLLAFIILLCNIGLIQITYYTMTEDTQKIINVISKDIKNPQKQSVLYVNMGLDYLMKDLSEESRAFLEKNFMSFTEPRREEILEAYNTKQVFMQDNKALFGVVSTVQPLPEVYRKYIKRMDVAMFERVLIEYFGENPKLTQTIVKDLYAITSAYGKKLPFDKFKFSVYDLLSFPHGGDNNSVALKLLGNVEPTAIKDNLFLELKTKPINVDDLNVWVNVLQKYAVISTEQYAGFTNSYGSITQLRNRYSQLETQEVDLLNMKDKVDVQTNAIALEKEKYEGEKVTLEKQLQDKKKELGKYNQYQMIKLYVMDYYGDGQYEASIPEKSWFFETYKPTNEKVVIKVTSTNISKQGVYDFKVYNKGTHNSGLPYFEELSNEDLARLDKLQSEVGDLESKINQKKNEIAQVNEEINVIRKSQNYDEILLGIEEVNKSKEQVTLSLQEHKVTIQNLFGIGQVDIAVQIKK